MEVNNFDSYIIHIYILYTYIYIYILCTWVCPTMRQCTTCINLNRENNDQPWGFRMYDMTFFWTNSYTHPDLVWVMLVVFNNSEDVWSICFDSPPAAKKTHDSKMPSKNFDNSYPLPFLNTWGANRLNAPRCLERCWSSREVVSQIEPAEVAKRFQHLHLRSRFLVSKNFQHAEMTSLGCLVTQVSTCHHHQLEACLIIFGENKQNRAPRLKTNCDLHGCIQSIKYKHWCGQPAINLHGWNRIPKYLGMVYYVDYWAYRMKHNG
jgi:hypothetical protein